jgi:hypothetical protein
MRALLGAVAGLVAAAAVGFWVNGQFATAVSESQPSVAPSISPLEMHSLAHLEFLPIQQVGDQSVVFADARRD